MIRSRFLFMAVVVLAAVVIVGGTGAGIMRHILSRELPTNDTQYFYIERGSGLLRTSYLAQEKGLVSTRWHFMLAAQLLGMERSLQAGEYELGPSMSLRDVFDKIRQGERYFRRVAIPEGLSSKEVEVLLRQSFGLDTKGLVAPGEGTLLPDTYFYERGDQATSILKRMTGKQAELIAKLWDNRAPGLPFDTIDEALTLASIVEKETAVAEERAMVAAVFVNRLRKGMRLQSDPTVIYGITGGIALGRPISRADLNATTPYNTYRVAGLPPTPIANPGRQSIAAVLNPADVPYLYFVADGTGGHAFATSLEDHNRNVARWRQFERKSRP
ncbi:endolytic transglycosylase MltG [Kordiimonas aestuarii]|uniref:endolytic transglycosylase MltG n=1 Tax=Kordiimonas aestuarii TaxID=1005925 RepID=UPI0021CE719B|nr:endolytic transglycosylase MltG [Kordiimonas aestuarii]